MISSVSNQGAYASSMMRGGMQRSAPPDPAELFSKTDANGDGTIDKVELSDALAAKSETEGAGNGPDADELFSMLDADGDGSITEEEHTQGLENLGAQGGPQGMNGPPPPPPGQESEEDEEDLFAATDADGSGTIELEELSSMLSGLSESEDSQETSQVEELFSLLDADGDGAVTSEEHSQGLEEMAAEREEKRKAMQGSSALITAALQNYRFAAMDYDQSGGGSQLSTSA